MDLFFTSQADSVIRSRRSEGKVMKIAHVVDSMEVGGAETLVAQMCRIQREHGHDPSIYAIARLGLLGEQLRREGFLVRPAMARRLHDAIPTFYRAFSDVKPDVVHLHNPRPTIFASLSARMAAVQSVVSTRHSLVGKPRRPMVEFKYAAAATCCNWIVGICDATAANLRSLGTIPLRKIVRIYNGVTPIQRAPRESCPRKDGFTFLFVGRLAPVKNIPLLLNSFARATASHRELRLWIVGDGVEREVLEHEVGKLKISSYVSFWGEQLDVAPFFSAADAFVMASLSEGLPISLLQAFSSGLPVIVTDVGGMGEVVRISRAGLTVRPEDTGEMADAISTLATSPEARRAFSQNAELAFKEWFELTTMADAYTALYQRNESPNP